MHTCRGNFRSAWVAEGGYEPVAEQMFSSGVDGFFMEFDTERAGGFEPLRFVPKGKQVVLGLVSSKTGALEDKDSSSARSPRRRSTCRWKTCACRRMRVLEHAPRQPADRGRAVAQAGSV